MSRTHVNFKADARAKDQFEAIVNQLGMTASTAYNLFINATIQRQGIPFDLALDPLTIPEVKTKVVAELKRRLDLEGDPNIRYLTLEESKREVLGL
ncbi:MAG: type II toxin-antitoxin system RelB/DinJ family antitoxin [Clostridia bacterium]|nr:type II toxin-antitoxin system RelB/DinJ family antitoxin [Clostridia bacterium]